MDFQRFSKPPNGGVYAEPKNTIFEYFLELYKSNSDRIIVDEKLSEIIESDS